MRARLVPLSTWPLLAATTLCLLMAGCSESTSALPASAADPAAQVALDQAWLVGTHNSYWVDRGIPNDLFAGGVQENLLDQLLADHVRAIELDVHPDRNTPRRYRVYHSTPGNSLCDDFADCLRVLRILQYALPQHEAVHVIVELKEFTASNFDADHTVEDFEAILESELGQWMIRPRDILARCGAREGNPEPAFLDCLTRGGWPSLADARGHFIVSVLSNFDDLYPTAKGTLDWATFTLHGNLFDRSAFSMASSWKLDWDTLPAKIQQGLSRDDLARARQRAAFLQVEDTNDPSLGPFLAGRGLVRIDGASSIDDQATRVALGAQIMQTDAPWVQLDDHGPAQPVRPFSGTEIGEPGERVLLSVSPEGSTFGERFAWRAAGAAPASWLETVPSVGATSDALACVAAADSATASPASSYLVCRGKVRAARTSGRGNPESEKLTLQVRICDNGTCNWSRLSLQAAEERAATIAVQFTGTCVQPFVAGDLDTTSQPTWRAASDPVCFSAALAAQGLAVIGDPEPQSAGVPPITSRSAVFVHSRVRTNDGPRTIEPQDLQ